MRKLFAELFTLSILLFNSSMTLASPWFTGPILAQGGRTIPKGHTNFETYAFYTLDTGFYNNQGHWKHTLTDNSKVINPVFSHGIAESMDLQFSLPYSFNQNHGVRSSQFGDVAIALGYQAMEQNSSKWTPNLRITVQEIIPTGIYKTLDPALNGTDATGLGSYQTAFGLNFQHLAQFSENHYLRTRLVLNYVAAAPAHLDGLSSYGGTKMTVGNIKPGSLWSIDLAGEFTLTQNWVAVMETYIARRQATHFEGFVGFNPDGSLGSIGRDAVNLYTLAPAIEYNFTPYLGLIAGTWFTVQGRNSAHFNTYVIALNAYW